jgi:signal peptidase I
LLLLAQEQSADGGFRGIIDSVAKTQLSKVVAIVTVLTVLRFALSSYLSKTLPKDRSATYGFARVANEILDAVIYAGVVVFMVIRPFVLQAFLIPSGSMWPTLYVSDFIVANKAIYRYTDPRLNDIVVFRPPVAATYGHPEQVDRDGTVNVDFIKRCVGLPGDVVEVREGVLYRNGKKASDPHKHYSLSTDEVNFSELPTDDVLRMPLASFKFIRWNGRLTPLNYLKSSANATVAERIDNQVVYSVAPEFVIPDPNDQIKAIKSPAQPLPPGCYLMMGDNRDDSFDSRGWGFVTRDAIIGRSEFVWLPLNRIGATR